MSNTPNTRKTKRLVLFGLMSSMALVLSYLEAILPPLSVSFPGIKMGLPNIVIIVVLYKFGAKEAAAVSLVRLAAVALLFGNVMTLAYSFAGAVLSLTVMTVLKKVDIFSKVGVSIAGGVCHNLGQIMVAIILLQTPQIGYYMIVLTITGTIAGAFIGLLGSLCIKYLNSLKM